MKNTANLTRGVFHAQNSEKKYHLTRVKPQAPFCDVVETYWQLRWDLRDQPPHVQKNIPDACINLTIENNKATVFGTVSKRFEVELKDKGEIFAIKFHPGGFYALTASPVFHFTDQRMSMDHFFGVQCATFVDDINVCDDMTSKIKLTEQFFNPFLPKSCAHIKNTKALIEQIKLDPDIKTVQQLAEKSGTSVRRLQRNFRDQVGISPKWVIRKHRIQEVLSRIEDGEYRWQNLIDELDYFDQAHFIKDFKNLVGMTPLQYIKIHKH